MAILSSKEAQALLLKNQVVALPTETVYGLAALISSDQALTKIFTTKDRPFFDPLIVHVKDQKSSESLAQWNEVSRQLAEKLWPGPLTIVLPRNKAAISDLITNGGPTVALRCPAHALFHQVIDSLPSAVAAPSANRFGHTSPTTADHVIDEFNNAVPVVDGGPCDQGIESTIVEYDEITKTLWILRDGVISGDDLQKTLNSSVTIKRKPAKHAPGHLKNHYQPKSLLFFVELAPMDSVDSELLQQLKTTAKQNVTAMPLPGDPRLAARQLYAQLRQLSASQQPAYVVISAEQKQAESWQGLVDRLSKACHYFVKKNGDQWDITAKS